MAPTYDLPVVPAPFTTNYPGAMDWSVVRAGFWVGRLDGRLSGVIEERWAGAFVAYDRETRPLGTFPSLWDAQAAFDND